VQSAVATNPRTVVSASTTVSCPAGTVLFGGGGTVTTTDTLDTVQLVASYPSATDTWTVTGAANIGPGKTWSIRAYAICGS
jgi:hypothetical protein